MMTRRSPRLECTLGLLMGLVLVGCAGDGTESAGRGGMSAGKGLLSDYCNPRFGYCVMYPAELQVVTESENGDGMVLGNGFDLLVTLAGSNNTAEATVESELTGQLNQVEAILRREQGESSFVLLGEDSNGMRIMVKEYVGTGSINSVRVEYPAQFRDSYEAIATAIIDSLEPGNLEQSF